jgi:hypothetical protein
MLSDGDDEVARRREIPSQFGLVERLRLGPIEVSFRQGGCLGLGLVCGYLLLTEPPFTVLPPALRLAVALALLALAALFAWRRPGGRPFEQWLLVALRYAVIPHHSVWRPREPRPDEWQPPARGGFAPAAPRVHRAPGEHGVDRR